MTQKPKKQAGSSPVVTWHTKITQTGLWDTNNLAIIVSSKDFTFGDKVKVTLEAVENES